MKAIIFDCFGVLTTDGWKQLREEFFSHDDAKMRHATDMDKAVNAGFMEYDTFITEISSMSGLPEVIVRQRMNGSAPNSALFHYIRSVLKPQYKIGMLSNAAANWLNDMFEPWQVELFDNVALSYEVGAAKPDTRMYQTITERLGVEYDQSLFIDDSEHCVMAAIELGMQGIYHTETSQTINKINELINA